MMGETEGQPTFYYNMSIEQFVPQDHPLRAIRPLYRQAGHSTGMPIIVFAGGSTVDTS